MKNDKDQKSDLDLVSQESPHFVSQPVDPEVTAWEEVAEGRFMPKRIRGSCAGRALG